MKKIFWVLVLALCVYVSVDMVNHYEKYDSVARYRLMLAIDEGDSEALQYYKEKYINDGIYLFNGDKSFDLFAENVGIKNDMKEKVYNEYIEKGSTLQQFAKEYGRR